MHFSIISLFPEYFDQPLRVGVVGQSFEKGRITYSHINPREFSTESVHKAVDDRPFGGGDGMVMMAEPLAKSIEKAKAEQVGAQTKVINFSPQGRTLNQKLLEELSQEEHLILICGRYAGIDERLVQSMVDLEISLGDFILSGGEVAALATIDGICRQLPHTLGNENSCLEDSYSIDSIFESPQFTRPADWRGFKVPQMLLSGHHKNIQDFKRKVGLARAILRRPDLTSAMSERMKNEILDFMKSLSEDDKKVLGLNESSQL